MTKNRIFSALLAMIMLMGNAYAANPKREMRSTWFTTVWGIDCPNCGTHLEFDFDCCDCDDDCDCCGGEIEE